MADDGSLATSDEWLGHFAPPEGLAESARPGRLSYTPEGGLSLQLIGGFKTRTLSAIVGTVERLPVTLVDCIATSGVLNFFDEEPIRQTVDVKSALFGIFLKDADTSCFARMDIEVEHLTQWSVEQDLDVSGSQVGDSRLIGGWPPMAEWRR